VAEALARRAAIVNDAAQHREQLWNAVDLIDDYQPGGLRPQVGVSIIQPPPVSRPLHVQIDRAGRPPGGHTPGQGGLADLSWTQQHGCWHHRTQAADNFMLNVAIYHSRKFNI
jgi:hypothetical protein